MSSVPIERFDNITDNSIILQHYNQPESDSTEDLDANQHKTKEPKKPKNQLPITFYCDFHKRVFKLAPQAIYNHFKIHEEEVLLLSDYEKVQNTRLVDLYEKNF